MNKLTYQFWQSITVLGLAVYLTERWISGRLAYYINLRFLPLIILAIVILLIMGISGLQSIVNDQENDADRFSDRAKAQKQNWIVLFLLPFLVTLMGLSITVIIPVFIMVILVGWLRLFSKRPLDLWLNNRPKRETIFPLLLLCVPLILGCFVPIKSLSASSLEKRGVSLSSPMSLDEKTIQTVETVPDDRTILDWIKIFNYEQDINSYLNTPANIIGFVYHDSRLKTGQFMVSRFAVTCCVADAFAIGMIVNWPQAASLEDNTWVNIKGTIDKINLDDAVVPIIQAEQVIPVDEPEQPYLYP